MDYHQLELQLSAPLSLAEFLGGEVAGHESGSPWTLAERLRRSQAEIESQAWIFLSESGWSKEEFQSFQEFSFDLLPYFTLQRYPQSVVQRFRDFAKGLTDDEGWQRAVFALSRAASATLPPDETFVFQQALASFGKWVHRVQQGELLRRNHESVAEVATGGFCLYLRSEGHDVAADFEDRLKTFLSSYLTCFGELLHHPCEREVGLLHTHVWVRYLAAHLELDFAQWAFLVASVEQAVFKKVGPETALLLTTYLRQLSKCLTELTFVGGYMPLSYNEHPNLAVYLRTLESAYQ